MKYMLLHLHSENVNLFVVRASAIIGTVITILE